MNWQTIAEHISTASSQQFTVDTCKSISGGDINSAYLLHGDGKNYFIKINRKALVDMFAAEAEGLLEIATTHTVKVPKPIVYGTQNNDAYLVLDYIAFGKSDKSTQRILGQQLAELHRIPQPYFGWHRDNTIGSTPQPNRQNHSWIEFWRDQRLLHQTELAARNGYRGQLQRLGDKLSAKLSVFFDDYIPHPSLLHGDLWGGNAATDQHGNPIIFDPACYYGDREADLAMTELFGGFGSDFYAAYQATYPLDKGYQHRKKLYNLYHILNHLNLFGGGYHNQAENMLTDLLRLVD